MPSEETPLADTSAPESFVVILGKALPATHKQREAFDRLVAFRDRRPDEIAPLLGDDSCIMCRFGNVWIGIERDGYTHS